MLALSRLFGEDPLLTLLHGYWLGVASRHDEPGIGEIADLLAFLATACARGE